MAIKTGQEDGVAQISLDASQCTNCGLCALVCKGAPLIMVEGKLVMDQARFFGCMGCGHCMCVCPHDCIKIDGRDISFADLIPLPEKEKRASYDQLYALLLSRRSIRNFRDNLVEPELIAQIVDAAATAPMGLCFFPP